MFLCKRDALLQTIAKGVNYCVGKISDDFYKSIIDATDGDLSYDERVDKLNTIEGLRAVNVGEEVTSDFLSSNHWFAETVQADKSCAVMYNSNTKDVALITFYDREADFFIVDYIDLENVPPDSILKGPISSLSECIVYREELLGKYDKSIILQGKEA